MLKMTKRKFLGRTGCLAKSCEKTIHLVLGSCGFHWCIFHLCIISKQPLNIWFMRTFHGKESPSFMRKPDGYCTHVYYWLNYRPASLVRFCFILVFSWPKKIPKLRTCYILSPLQISFYQGGKRNFQCSTLNLNTQLYQILQCVTFWLHT